LGDDFKVYTDILKGLLKKYQKTQKILERNYKLTKKEIDQILSNQSFSISIRHEFEKDLEKEFKIKGFSKKQLKYAMEKSSQGSPCK
jgi:response regulator of citrate/malate metabolism